MRFLDVMALQNGKETHYANISGDAGVPARTVENYMRILKDTMLGFEVAPFLAARRRKAVTRSRFYFFDVGVAGRLARRGEVLPGSAAFGECFEHWLMTEVRAFLGISRRAEPMRYWRAKTGQAVDLVIGDRLALEFKATPQVLDRHLKGLRALREEGLVREFAVVSLDPARRVTDGITIYPWREFMKELWDGSLPGLA